MREEMLASLLSQSAGEELDFAEFATPDASVPLHGRVSLTAGQRQGNWPHQVEVQAWSWRFRHLYLSAIGVDPEQFAVSNQSFADVWIDVSEHGWPWLGVCPMVKGSAEYKRI